MAEQLGYVFDPITGDIMRDADGNPVQSLSGQKTTADIGYTNAMADRARTDAMKNGVSSSGLDAIGKEAMDAINKGLFGDMYFSLTPQVDPVTKATTYIKTPITPEDQTAVYNRFSDWAWNKAQKAATDDEQRLSIFDFLLSQWTGNRPTNTVPQAPVAFPSGRPTIN
jgi:hypothetical protein